MKKLLVVSALTCIGVSLFAADGATLYRKCAACHGAKADKVYLNKVPAIRDLSSEQRLQYMREYAEGKRNAYGQGAIMRINLRGLTEEDFQAIEAYIQTL